MQLRVFIVAVVVLALSISVAQARSYVAAYAKGDKNPTIEVAELDDPANPYKDQYTLLDRWAFNNFAHYINDENFWTLQMSLPNIERGLQDRGITVKIEILRSYVEFDAPGEQGYLVPELAYLQQGQTVVPAPETLGGSLLHQQVPSQKDERPYFWSLGLEDAAALAERDEAIARALAPDYPKLTDWMLAAGSTGDLYSFLPDGGVIVAVPEVKGDFSKRMSQLTRYDAAGNVVRQVEGDYMDIESKFLFEVPKGATSQYLVFKDHAEASGRKTGQSNNAIGTGRYRAFYNEQRDGFLAVVDYWQGKILTPAYGDLTALPVDPYPYFGMVDYEEVARVYTAQQAQAQR